MPFEKNFYIEHPDVQKRSEQEAADWRASHQIVVKGNDVPKPVMTFEEASMPEYILTEVLKQGFSHPTPIQSQGWPMALKGRNTVGVSATGSGKTLGAFNVLWSWHVVCYVHDFIDFFFTNDFLSARAAAFLLPAMIHINAQVS